jgi:hypothetical protein
MSSTSGENKHIMLSYQKESRTTVNDVYSLLQEKIPVPIWMDKQGGITSSVSKGMAFGVENSICICCFITPEYQASQNCEAELSYAQHLKIPIIPFYMAEKGWEPSGWLGFRIHDLLHLDFRNVDETNISDKCDELVEKIYQLVPKDIMEDAIEGKILTQ